MYAKYLIAALVLLTAGLGAQSVAVDLLVLDSITRSPLEGVTVRVPSDGGGAYYFTNEKGRVRIFIPAGGKYALHRVGYHAKPGPAGTGGATVLLVRSMYALGEVTVRAEKVDLYALLNRLLKKIRSTRQVENKRLFRYELNTRYDTVLVELSDGIVRLAMPPGRGVLPLEFICGRYCLSGTYPFFNNAFLHMPALSGLFQKSNKLAVITPLNYGRLTPGNTRIKSLPCDDCGEHRRLLRLEPKDERHATAELMFDLQREKPEELRITQSDSRALRPIVQHHEIRNLDFSALYRMQEGSVQYVQIDYHLDYLLPGHIFPGVRAGMRLYPLTGISGISVLQAGFYDIQSDYEHLITYPFDAGLLERHYHPADAALLESAYARMRGVATLEDHASVSHILRVLSNSPVLVWDTGFVEPPVRPAGARLFAPAHEQTNDYFFFNWLFTAGKHGGSVHYRSTPSFCDTRRINADLVDTARLFLLYNLFADFSELRRREVFLMLEQHPEISEREAEQQVQRAFAQMKNEILLWARKSGDGTRISPLKDLNAQIQHELGKNNFVRYHHWRTGTIKPASLIYPDLLAMHNETGEAIAEYSRLLGQPDLSAEERQMALLGRARCHLHLKNYRSACADLADLQASRYPGLDESLLQNCR
ncbi:MAG: hypothetical protein KDC61_21710 [Saprospiraceae bacterium]|nr:hypothetical protein [Saprospiraceae bacterium]MCB0542263.1 hypothetical protein [Saprospiraceae bacterium]MCB0577191.1 hypothetical protein [Saprospiraceae bacterium]